MSLKNSFSYLEVVAILVILALFYTTFSTNLNQEENKLEIATQRVVLYLKQTRIQAMLDDKFDPNDNEWHKKRWTLKFLRCSRNVGGVYYSVYSDTNKKGHINKEESLKDPLTNKYIYSHNDCEYRTDSSKYVLLTQEFNIVDVQISCNTTTSLGQLSFGNKGELYTNLSDGIYDNLVTQPCQIKLINSKGEYSTIQIEPNTGFIKINIRKN